MNKLPKHLAASLKTLDQELLRAKEELSETDIPLQDQKAESRQVAYINNPDWRMHTTTTTINTNTDKQQSIKLDFRLRLSTLFDAIAQKETRTVPITNNLSPEISTIVTDALLPQTIGHLDETVSPHHPEDTVILTLEKDMILFEFCQAVMLSSGNTTIDMKIWTQQCRLEADLFLAHKELDTIWQWQQDDGLELQVHARWSPTK